MRLDCGERRFNLEEFTLSKATAHCLKPAVPQVEDQQLRAMHVSLVELSAGKMPQWRS